MNNAILNISKFILAAVFLPIAWASASEFHRHIMRALGAYSEFFFWGMFGFTLLYLFFYQFWGVYELGQKITAGIFQFTSPANRLMADIVPFYLTVIMLLFSITQNFLEVSILDHYFMFFSGFAFTMHVVLTAQNLQEPESAFIKPTYLFSAMVVLPLVVCVTVLLFDLVQLEFAFPEFAQSVIGRSLDIYVEASRRLAFWN